jgi:hypothetical protein
MDRETINAVKYEIQKMALLDDRFRIVYDFFQELGTVDKRGFVIVCRAKMPFVAHNMVETMPPLNNTPLIQHMKGVHYLSDEEVNNTPLIQHMKGVHYLSDEEVIAVCAVFLKTIISTVQELLDKKS